MFRDKFANNLGISQVRKEQVYLDICKAVSLEDISYWIQVLFAAGIATLGLVLNSPAVIIGAMLMRSQPIIEYLQLKWQISDDRIKTQIGTETQRNVKLNLTVESLSKPPLETLQNPR